MKKLIFLLVIIFVTGQTVQGQDRLKGVMAELSKLENVQRQVVDKDMLNSQMEQAMAADPTGELKSQMPSFMQKIDSIEVLAAGNVDEETYTKMVNDMDGIKDGDGYETILTVKEDSDYVRIMAYKEADSILAVYIIAMDKGSIAFVKMEGTLSHDDLIEIIEKQKKNK
jgi:hypothetical protein